MKAGNIDFLYEGGFIRQCKINGIEVLRNIYFAVRDENWGNIEALRSEELIEDRQDSFTINYKVTHCRNGESLFLWNVHIDGRANSEIEFEINGEALKDFRTNRAGFCVLHPIEGIAGYEVNVTNSEAQKKEYTFPTFIAPHQPIFDITTMTWTAGRSRCKLQFFGDIFEMEDQRNWGDASYKTYCTPLHIPFPRQIIKGQKIHQKVIFTGEAIERHVVEEPMNTAISKAYDLGIGYPNASELLATDKIMELSSSKYDHVRIELDLTDCNWENDALMKYSQVMMFSEALEIALIVNEDFNTQLHSFYDFNRPFGIKVKYLLLLSKNKLVTDQAVIDYIPAIRDQYLETKIGVGSLYNFTEINRNRFHATNADFIAFSFDPQQHASDDLTIMENAATVKYLVASATELYQKPIHISPILLKKRFNPNATQVDAIVVPIERQNDDRYQTDFIKKWTSELMKNLAISGVASVSLFQTHGPQSGLNV